MTFFEWFRGHLLKLNYTEMKLSDGCIVFMDTHQSGFKTHTPEGRILNGFYPNHGDDVTDLYKNLYKKLTKKR